MTNSSSRLADNLAAVQMRIAAAATRSGRSAEEVTLVAVTKYVGVAEVRALMVAGCRDLGESRPRELWLKAKAIPEGEVHWHLIGHLQRNKIRRTLPLAALVHSVDSLRLLSELDAEAMRLGQPVQVLLEVNCSGDAAKHGFKPAAVSALLPELARFPHVQVRGLMTMAALGGDAGTARRNFAQLRELRDQLRGNCPPGVSLDELSMGMSGDFEAAIEEGATIVRIGSALFEGLDS